MNILAIALTLCFVVAWDYVQTLCSLRRVPNTKIYLMDYFADYNLTEIRDQGVNPADVSGSLLKALLPDFVVPVVRPFIPDDEEVLPPRDHSCSTASICVPNGRVLVGRNFDWVHKGCLVVRIHQAGRESVAVVDPHYLGIRDTDLDDMSLRQRLLLLGAPYLVVDGMNEHGVVITSMSCLGQEPENDPKKPTLVQSVAMRLVLDYAKSTVEAVELLRKYKLDPGVLPYHLMIVDRTGESVVLEYVGGELKAITSREPWRVCTNHLLFGRSEKENDAICDRYRKASGVLANANGDYDADDMTNLMSSITFERWTMWTSVYDLSTGEFRIAHRRDFDNVHSGKLRMAPQGARAAPDAVLSHRREPSFDRVRSRAR
jgi:hypothetical protein